jgi:hypothetical protein
MKPNPRTDADKQANRKLVAKINAWLESHIEYCGEHCKRLGLDPILSERLRKTGPPNLNWCRKYGVKFEDC